MYSVWLVLATHITSQGTSLRLSLWAWWAEYTFPGQGRTLWLPGYSLSINQQSCPLDYLLTKGQRYFMCSKCKDGGEHGCELRSEKPCREMMLNFPVRNWDFYLFQYTGKFLGFSAESGVVIFDLHFISTILTSSEKELISWSILFQG